MSDDSRLCERAEQFFKVAKTRLDDANLEKELALGTYLYCLGNLVRAHCTARGIFPSPQTYVRVDFADGPQVCIFEKIEYASSRPIFLRHLTKHYRPRARPERYEWTLAKLMTPVAKPSKPA